MGQGADRARRVTRRSVTEHRREGKFRCAASGGRRGRDTGVLPMRVGGRWSILNAKAQRRKGSETQRFPLAVPQNHRSRNPCSALQGLALAGDVTVPQDHRSRKALAGRVAVVQDRCSRKALAGDVTCQNHEQRVLYPCPHHLNTPLPRPDLARDAVDAAWPGDGAYFVRLSMELLVVGIDASGSVQG